jgi:Flp pilus assembly protein TadG
MTHALSEQPVRLPAAPPATAHRHGRSGLDRGQSLAEFALIVPILFLLAVAIGDFGRIFNALVAVESAAREAADYGAFLGSDAWQESNAPWSGNDTEMRRRACAATSQLSSFNDPDGTCSTNPVVTWTLEKPSGVSECGGRTGLVEPCRIRVTVTYEFKPFVALPPIPESITLSRESIFAISDLTGS